MPLTHRGLITQYSDEIVRGATVTTDGTTATGYGLANLYDDRPGKLTKFNEQTVGIQIDCGSAQPLALVSLHHMTPEAGETVLFQANATASWGSPSISVAIDVAGWVGAGESRYPLDTWFDVSTVVGFNPAGYRYYRLAFDSLSQDLQIGQIRLHPEVTYIDPDRGMGVKPIRLGTVNRTAFGIETRYRYGVALSAYDLTLSGLEDADKAALLEQWHDVDGDGHPFVFVPDLADPACILGRWGSGFDLERALQVRSIVKASVVEVGRGLRPGV
jgi:hypothetical protein